MNSRVSGQCLYTMSTIWSFTSVWSMFVYNVDNMKFHECLVNVYIQCRQYEAHNPIYPTVFAWTENEAHNPTYPTVFAWTEKLPHQWWLWKVHFIQWNVGFPYRVISTKSIIVYNLKVQRLLQQLVVRPSWKHNKIPMVMSLPQHMIILESLAYEMIWNMRVSVEKSIPPNLLCNVIFLLAVTTWFETIIKHMYHR